MEYLKLSNGVQLPYLGLALARLPDYEDAYNTVRSALDLGYRQIDTAQIYQNEAAVGAAIKDSKIDRADIFITTKLSEHAIKEGRIAEAFSLSLEKLQVEYVDLYLVHLPLPGHYVSAWTRLETFYQEGRTRAIGIANHQVADLTEILVSCQEPPMVNQFEIHPYLSQTDLVRYCALNGIQPVAVNPFCEKKNNVLEDQTITDLSKKYQKTPAQIILRWNIERDIAVVVKSMNPARQAANLEVFDFSLSEPDVNLITALNRDLRVDTTLN